MLFGTIHKRRNEEKILRKSGLVGYLNTNDARDVVERIEKGDKEVL